jgi:hypothetical protein
MSTETLTEPTADDVERAGAPFPLIWNSPTEHQYRVWLTDCREWWLNLADHYVFLGTLARLNGDTIGVARCHDNADRCLAASREYKVVA